MSICGNWSCFNSAGTSNDQTLARIDCLKVKTLNYTYDYEQVSTSASESDHEISNKPTLQELIDGIANCEDTKEFHDYPTPGFFQRMSQRVYKKTEENYETWQLIYAVKRSHIPGFYAQLYLEPVKKQMVLVFKGSDHFCNFVTDLKSVLWLFESGEINAAFTFGEKVRLLIEKLNHKVQLFITGHSLGGFLAQIVTYTIKNVCIHKGEACKSDTKFNIHPYTVVFDSPPCFNWIQKIAQNSSVSDIFLDLPITNYLVRGNLVNAYQGLGLHVGLLLSNVIETPGCFMLFSNAVSYHGLDNFKDIDNWDPRKFEDITRGEYIVYEPTRIPINTFTALEVERLQILQNDSDIFADILNDELKGYKIIVDKFIQLVPLLGNVPVEEENKVQLISPAQEAKSFIPRARSFLAKYKDQLSQSSLHKKIHAEMKKMWESAFENANNDVQKKIRFSESILGRVNELKSGDQLFAKSVRIADLVFFAQVLKNSTHNLCYILHKSINNYKIAKIKCESRTEVKSERAKCKGPQIEVDEPLLNEFSGTLVLILEENEECKVDINLFEKVIILGGAPIDSRQIALNAPKLHDFHEASQPMLENWKLNFLKNEYTTESVFMNLMSPEFSIFEIVSFKSDLKEGVESKLDSGFYVEHYVHQKGGDERKFKSNADLSKHILSEKKNLVISSGAGMGKSTYLKNLREKLQNKDNWVVALTFREFADKFVDLETKTHGICLKTTKDAIDLVTNKLFRFKENALTNTILNESETVLQTKVFKMKLNEGKVIFLLDAFDEVCPNHREIAKKFIKLISESGVPVVVSCRPQEENEIVKMEETQWEIYQLQGFDEYQFSKYLVQYWQNNSNEDDYTLWEQAKDVLKKLEANAPKDRAYKIPIPLHCRMLADAYLTGEDILGGNINIFKFYFEKMINEHLKVNVLPNSSTNAIEEKRKIMEICHELAYFILESPTEKPDWLTDESKNKEKIIRCNIVGFAFIDQAGNVEFLHQTFAEYFLADGLVFKICNERPFVSTELLINVLTKAEYKVVRHFMELISVNKLQDENLTKCQYLTVQDDLKSFILFLFINEDCLHTYKMLVVLRITFDLKEDALLTHTNFVEDVLNIFYKCSIFLDAKTIRKIRHQKPCFKLTPLNLAILYGSEKFIFELLKNGAEVAKFSDCNSTDSDCLSILHYATRRRANKFIKDHFDDIKSSHLNLRLNYDNTYFYSLSPLQIAVETGNVEILDFLIGKEADCTVLNDESQTLFHIAVINRHFQVVEKLLEYEILHKMINQVDKSKMTCLWRAVERGQKEMVSLLLKYPEVNVNCTYRGETLLELAVKKGEAEILNMLLKKGMKLDKLSREDGKSYLHLAVQGKSTEIIKMFNLEYGIDINCKDKKGNTPLYYAVFQKDPIVVQELLNLGANVTIENDDGQTSLYNVAFAGWVNYTKEESIQKIIEMLPNKKTDLSAKDKKGKTLLHCAVQSNTSAVKCLFNAMGPDAGDLINLVDENGCTPLHLACANVLCPQEVLEMLLSKGADPLLKDKFGRLPLHNALVSINEFAVAVLLQHHAQNSPAPDLTATERATSGKINKIVATAKYYLKLRKIIPELIKNKANPSVTDMFGQQPMHYLIQDSKSLKCCDLYNANYSGNDELEVGGAINSRDNAGMTPLHLACISISNLQNLKKTSFYFLEPKRFSEATQRDIKDKHNVEVAELCKTYKLFFYRVKIFDSDLDSKTESDSDSESDSD